MLRYSCLVGHFLQEAQLSQTDRVTLRVIENLVVTQGNSKLHR